MGAVDGPMEQDPRSRFEYDLFISYRRRDGGGYARWLRRKLAGFQVPKALEHRGGELRVYLDTAHDRVTPDFWRDNIQPALRTSRFLLIVATNAIFEPDDERNPNWVRRELADFVETSGWDKILVAHACQTKEQPLLEELATHLPRLQYSDIRPVSWSAMRALRHLRERNETLRNATTGIIAAALDIEPAEMPVLREEQERQRRRFAWAVSGALALFLVVTITLAAVAWVQRGRALDNADLARRNEAKAVENQKEAERQKGVAVANELEARRQTEEAQRLNSQLRIELDNVRYAQNKEREAVARGALATAPVGQSVRRSGFLEASGFKLRSRLRPLQPGASVGTAGRDSVTGTLCCLVEDASGTRFLLSMNTVAGSLQSSLIQPGQADGGTLADAVGVVSRRGPDRLRSGALVQLKAGTQFNLLLPDIARWLKVATRLPSNRIVIVLGRGSGLLPAQLVSGDPLTVSVGTPLAPGDAGALLLTFERELIGLVWGFAGSQVFGTPIQQILDELNVRLVLPAGDQPTVTQRSGVDAGKEAKPAPLAPVPAPAAAASLADRIRWAITKGGETYGEKQKAALKTIAGDFVHAVPILDGWLVGGTNESCVAAMVIEQIGPAAAPAMPKLIRMVQSGDWLDRQFAASAIAAIGRPAAAPAAGPMIQALRRIGEESTTARLTEALDKIGFTVAEHRELLDLMRDTRGELRTYAIASLMEIKALPVATMTELAQLLPQSNESEQRALVYSIAELCRRARAAPGSISAEHVRQTLRLVQNAQLQSRFPNAVREIETTVRALEGRDPRK